MGMGIIPALSIRRPNFGTSPNNQHTHRRLRKSKINMVQRTIAAIVAIIDRSPEEAARHMTPPGTVILTAKIFLQSFLAMTDSVASPEEDGTIIYGI
jgi:hypothetical protein